MAVTDGQVQVAPDSTGAKVDTSDVTRTDDSRTVVDRQRVIQSDPEDPNAHAGVSGEQGRGASIVQAPEILQELQSIRELLYEVKELMRELVYS